MYCSARSTQKGQTSGDLTVGFKLRLGVPSPALEKAPAQRGQKMREHTAPRPTARTNGHEPQLGCQCTASVLPEGLEATVQQTVSLPGRFNQPFRSAFPLPRFGARLLTALSEAFSAANTLILLESSHLSAHKTANSEAPRLAIAGFTEKTSGDIGCCRPSTLKMKL